MTHDEKRARRRLIAAAAARNSIGEAAAEFDVTAGTVRQACKENGVVPKKAIRIPSASTFAILKALLSGEKTARIAESFGVSKQYVSEIRYKAIAGGFTQLTSI